MGLHDRGVPPAAGPASGLSTRLPRGEQLGRLPGPERHVPLGPAYTDAGACPAPPEPASNSPASPTTAPDPSVGAGLLQGLVPDTWRLLV
eukprot:COSAG04_NODE_1885_length_5306_cov_14.242174_3_plen_90_part_00